MDNCSVQLNFSQTTKKRYLMNPPKKWMIYTILGHPGFVYLVRTSKIISNTETRPCQDESNFSIDKISLYYTGIHWSLLHILVQNITYNVAHYYLRKVIPSTSCSWCSNIIARCTAYPFHFLAVRSILSVPDRVQESAKDSVQSQLSYSTFPRFQIMIPLFFTYNVGVLSQQFLGSQLHALALNLFSRGKISADLAVVLFSGLYWIQSATIGASVSVMEHRVLAREIAMRNESDDSCDERWRMKWWQSLWRGFLLSLGSQVLWGKGGALG